MPSRKKGQPLSSLQHAFDEMRFGRERILNLRESLPTAAEAAARAESWLRQQQAQLRGTGNEVLVITGRGNQSEGGVSPVRERVVQLLHVLRRKNVVADVQEHTPGSFVVTLAPLGALVDAPRRRRDRESVPPPAPAAPPSLDALDPETRALLRDLAERSLDALGVGDRTPFMEAEMLRHFSAIAKGVPEGPNREARLRAAIRNAMEGYE